LPGTFSYGSGPQDSGFYDVDACFDYRCYAPSAYDCCFDAYPLVVPSAPIYGLGPLRNMLGAIAPAAPPRNIPGVAAEPAKPVVRPRVVNPVSLARAGRFLSTGDEHFAAQRYRDANARYRSATEAAPDLVEAFFRQGQALMALGQFELANRAFQRGLKLGDKWPQADFSLAELYGANQVAKMAHMEALAAAAGDAPQDGTLLLLVALQLYFDGQQDRSLPFFRKAAALLANEELNLDAVLKP
jgi:tetratricopeptide (TPR) repeat protein